MQIPLQITYRDMPPSEAVDASIRERAQKLEIFADNITSCRVVIEAPHKHHHKGQLFSIHIDITLPGHEIAVSRQPDKNHAHEDIYVAIRDAFDAARRQLEDYNRRYHGNVKLHQPEPHGQILVLNPEQNFGIIKTPDGREIYFHRNSIINADFDQLAPGMSVHFTESNGDQGPQASTVHIEGKHHTVSR
ncbi:MAG: 30S ribosomal protein S30 [Gammaproteobacteria bacterium]|nr:30S ribosomal protein S30 [Gammaproteobacteria bacterium]